MFSLDLNTMTWEKMAISGTLYARYSHTAHIYEDKLLLVGGVNTEQKSPGLAVISLTTFTALEFAFPAQDKQSLLMLHRHTSVLRPDKEDFQLVLLGGGGNCFSFGTHLNRTPVLVDIAGACGCMQQAKTS
ncbi:leucine carboxyl methyltransferase 2 [Plakobranchus ocellatus]|uniref:Leucine carboxyl methyltransferase 2 n=1 Tax=Plakobranchus ocellatus TaxID=259542 RepID=A0AAV4CQT3_9GAST|nr:leucine carboxyl methyltransferase 2 [Plakobranchus ocellatus]